LCISLREISGGRVLHVENRAGRLEDTHQGRSEYTTVSGGAVGHLATPSPLFASGAGQEAVPEQQPLHQCARRRFGSLAGIVSCFPFRVRTTSVWSGWTATTRQNSLPNRRRSRRGPRAGCVESGVQGTLLLSVYHHVTGPKTGRHALSGFYDG